MSSTCSESAQHWGWLSCRLGSASTSFTKSMRSYGGRVTRLIIKSLLSTWSLLQMMLLNCSSGGGDNVNTTTTYLADQIASSRNVIGDGAGEGRGSAYGHALHPNRFKWGCAAYVCEFDFIFRIKMLANLIFKNNINMLYNKVEDLSHPSSTSPDRNDRTACPRRRHIAPSLCRCLAGDCPRPPCRTPPLR